MPSRPEKPSARAASAGGMLVATTLLCAGIGAGIGALIGATLPLAVAGLLVGFPVGIAVVRVRYRDL